MPFDSLSRDFGPDPLPERRSLSDTFVVILIVIVFVPYFVLVMIGMIVCLSFAAIFAGLSRAKMVNAEANTVGIMPPPMKPCSARQRIIS